jgi:hypothetical protein
LCIAKVYYYLIEIGDGDRGRARKGSEEIVVGWRENKVEERDMEWRKRKISRKQSRARPSGEVPV